MISLNEHSISASIADRYAYISYKFAFQNLNEKGSNELRFEITIHPQAFISGFICDIDGELFTGKTKEKKQAKQEYAAAKEKNENAILISQPHENIPNLFQIQTNIDAKSKILLNVKIEQYLTKQFNFNQLHIELLKQFDKYNITKTYDSISFQFDVSDGNGISEIDIPSNEETLIIKDKIVKKLDENKVQITGKIMDKSSINELTLKYKVKDDNRESNILFDNRTKTFCHIISDLIGNKCEQKTQEINESVLIPRRVVIIIDRSGSMSGIKWNKTISATITALNQLRCGYDRFCVILCGNQLILHPNQQITVSDNNNIEKCIQILKKQRAEGCELINDALLHGIQLIKDDIKLLNADKEIEYNYYQNQVILLTDGEPTIGETNTDKIVENVKNANNLKGIDKYSSKICVHSFGIGRDQNDGSWTKDLNHNFLKLLSLNNHGIYQRIKETQTDRLLNEYFDILSKPILTNIKIKYTDTNCTDLTKTSFNTLFAGNDIIICGKLHNIKTLIITTMISAVTGQHIKQNNGKLIVKPIEINKTIKVKLNAYETNDDQKSDEKIISNNIERMWAYLKLKQFSEKRLMNDDMIEFDEDDDKIPFSLAMKYHFVSPWTSMIVVNSITEVEQKEQLKDNIFISSRRKSILEFHEIFDSNRRRSSVGILNDNDKIYLKSLSKSLAMVNVEQLEETPAGSPINSPTNNESQYEEEFREFERMSSEKVIQLEKYYVRQLEMKEAYVRKLEQQLKHFKEKSSNINLVTAVTNKLSDSDTEKQIQSLQKQLNEKDELVQNLQTNLQEISENQKKELTYFIQELQRMKTKCHNWSKQLMDKVCEIESNTMVNDGIQTKKQSQGKIVSLCENKKDFYDKDMMDELFKMGFKIRYVIQAIDNVENKTDKKEIMEYIITHFNDKLSGSLKRIVKELMDIKCNSMLNCSVVYDVSIWNWKVTIKGPIDSEYEDGVFDIDIQIPKDYPLQSPKCRFITKICHCNVNANGEIDLDILKHKWNSSLTISAVLLGIVNLLSNPKMY